MSFDYARVSSRVFNAPLLCTPDVADTVGAYVRARIAGDDVATGPQLVDRKVDRNLRARAGDGYKPYAIDQGIALIGIDGELANRGAWVGASSGLTSYEGIVSQIKLAAVDPEVQGILLEIDSPGGEGAGLSAVTDAIRNAGKPVWAIANALAASAAYWIGSTASRFAAVPDANGVGSIGVVWMHLNRAEQLQKAGVQVAVVQAGSKKTQFAPFSALGEEARARAEQVVSELYGSFVDHVAKARGMTPEAVMATEAEVFTAKEAKKLGLIDQVATVDKFHSEMVKAIRAGAATAAKQRPAVSAAIQSPKGNTMSDEKTYTAADIDAAKATARTEGVDAGKAEGIKLGAEAERARIGAILGCDEAKGREVMANHIAFKTASTVDDAKGLLAAAPKVEPENPLLPKQNLLDAAMKNEPDKTVQPDASVTGSGANAAADTPAAKAAAVRANAEKLFGKPEPGIR